VFEDEASFRQDATLHATWSRRGKTPIVQTASNRASVKVFGCVNVLTSRFDYQFAEKKFDSESYLDFLEGVVAKKYYPRQVCYIQDNASYHKDEDVWNWFKANKKWISVRNLPPYCPELNATETIWHYTRMNGMHNNYFDSKREIEITLWKLFAAIKRFPSTISGYMRPFT
jgi:putative transposase